MDKDNEKDIDYSLEVGISGLNRTGGWIFEEWLNDLKGIKGINHYKEMRDNDAVVGAFLFAVEMLIRQVKWRVDKAGDSQEDKEAAEFVEQCLFEDMEGTWQELISEILTELTFGWAYFEMVFKKRNGESKDLKMNSKFNDGRIGFRKIALRNHSGNGISITRTTCLAYGSRHRLTGNSGTFLMKRHCCSIYGSRRATLKAGRS